MKIIRKSPKPSHLPTAITLLFAVALVSCGQQTSEQAKEEPIVDEVVETEPEEKVTYPIPSPLELTEMLNEAKASYIFAIVNPPSKMESYISENSKALSLGVYGSDLSYSVTYNKTQQALEFFECSKTLRNDLSIQTPFMNDLAQKMEANIENKDSLYALLNKSFENTFEFLNAHEKSAVSSLVLAGGWIEGTYLAAELVSLSEDKNALVQIVANQGGSLQALNQFLEANKSNEKVSELHSELTGISELYSAIEEADGTYTISDEQFEAIHEKVAALRNQIVSAI